MGVRRAINLWHGEPLIRLLANVSRVFRDKCIDGIEANATVRSRAPLGSMFPLHASPAARVVSFGRHPASDWRLEGLELASDRSEIVAAIEKQFKGKKKAVEANVQAIDKGLQFTRENGISASVMDYQPVNLPRMPLGGESPSVEIGLRSSSSSGAASGSGTSSSRTSMPR